MSRGIMFSVGTDPNSPFRSMSAEYAIDHMDALGIDYAEDQSEEQSAWSLMSFASKLIANGFDVRFSGNSFELHTKANNDLAKCKMMWFEKDFAKLKSLVSVLDLGHFATSTTPSYEIKELTDNDTGDLIYLDALDCGASVCTVATFIRELEPETVYYVDSHTVFMH